MTLDPPGPGGTYEVGEAELRHRSLHIGQSRLREEYPPIRTEHVRSRVCWSRFRGRVPCWLGGGVFSRSGGEFAGLALRTCPVASPDGSAVDDELGAGDRTRGPVVVGVMQLEGHVLQPLILGHAVRLHPLAVVLGVTAGFVDKRLPGKKGQVTVDVAELLELAGWQVREFWHRCRCSGDHGLRPRASMCGLLPIRVSKASR